MSVIVFIGPTLPIAQAQQLFDADYRPPARQGDVYQACLQQPHAIVIIDGYFESIPAVWHKEVLYAMAQGIHVYGAASMGALRAAELDVFGMQGFGEVYRQFSQEILQDDDEVAVIHAPKEMGFMVASEAMVNIRATVQAALEAKIIDLTQSEKLLGLAKSTWYPQRSFSQLLTQAKPQLPLQTYTALSDFIDVYKVNIKQQDAIGLLKHLAQDIDNIRLTAKDVDYTFINTDAWDTMVEAVNESLLIQENDFDIDALLLELKLSGTYQAIVAQARERQTALNRAKAMAGELSDAEFKRTLTLFAVQQNSIRNGQIDFHQLAKWLTAQRLDMPGFDRLMRKQSHLARLATACPDFNEAVIDILRLNHQLAEFCHRLDAKQQHCFDNQDKLSEPQLWAWYFKQYLQQPIPRDLAIYAQCAGFNNVEQMRRAVSTHYHWFQLRTDKNSQQFTSDRQEFN